MIYFMRPLINFMFIVLYPHRTDTQTGLAKIWYPLCKNLYTRSQEFGLCGHIRLNEFSRHELTNP